jgi:hypothetical protein
MSKFKVGDKVKCINAYDAVRFGLKQNKIYKVVSLNSDSGFFVEGIDQYAFNNSRFELVNETSESKEEKLLRIINKGYKAINKLGKLVGQENVEFIFPDGIKKTLDALTVATNVVIKPKSKKFKLASWDCEIIGDTVKIGCETFNKVQLSQGIHALCKNGQFVYHFEGRAMFCYRDGIELKPNRITWEQAEQLLKELENA